MIRGVLKNVQISENESFRGAVFTVPAQGDATRNLEYHPPPDAKHFFVRFELTNGETSRVYGVPIQSGAWPYWMKLQGKRERGDAKLDELGLGTLYVAYDPRNRMNPRWSFWGPFFDCRSMQLRYALDEKGLLAARCRSDALEVAAPGDSRLLLLEYKLSDGSSALYRFAVDYAHLALQGMLAGLDEMQDWLTCSARGGSRPQMTCQWGNEMQWRLPAVDRVEYGPTASDLSGQTPVPIDFEAFLAASNQTGQLYNATRMPVVDVKADWPDVFARLVLEDGHATDVKRMVVRR